MEKKYRDNIISIIKHWFTKSIILIENSYFQNFGIFEKAINIFLLDYQRKFPNEKKIDINKLCGWATLQNTLLYRIANLFYKAGQEDAAQSFFALGRFLSGIEIYYSAEIGHSFLIHHGVGTVVGSRCRIGNNVTIYQGVTIGNKSTAKNDKSVSGKPIIGNDCIIFAGSQVLGGVKIGDGSIIGAHSLCIKDVPSCTIVAGSPCKVIRKIDSNK